MASLTDNYLKLCNSKRVEPFFGFIEHTAENKVDCDVDFVSPSAWGLFSLSLKTSECELQHFRIARLKEKAALHPPSQSQRVLPFRKIAVQFPMTDFTEAMISRAGFGIGNMLSTSPQLRSFHLVNIPLGSKGFTRLAPMFSLVPHLHTISLEGSVLGDSGLELLSEALCRLHQLRSLNLAACDLTDRSAPALVAILKAGGSRNTESAWTSSLRCGAGVVSAAALTKLNLSDNFFGDKTAIALASVLESDIGLVSLGLSNNVVMAQGVNALVQLMASTTALKVVSLNGNPGAMVAASALEEHGVSVITDDAPETEQGCMLVRHTTTTAPQPRPLAKASSFKQPHDPKSTSAAPTRSMSTTDGGAGHPPQPSSAVRRAASAMQLRDAAGGAGHAGPVESERVSPHYTPPRSKAGRDEYRDPAVSHSYVAPPAEWFPQQQQYYAPPPPPHAVPGGGVYPPIHISFGPPPAQQLHPHVVQVQQGQGVSTHPAVESVTGGSPTKSSGGTGSPLKGRAAASPVEAPVDLLALQQGDDSLATGMGEAVLTSAGPVETLDDLVRCVDATPLKVTELGKTHYSDGGGRKLCGWSCIVDGFSALRLTESRTTALCDELCGADDKADRCVGALLGLGLGDSLGAPLAFLPATGPSAAEADEEMPRLMREVSPDGCLPRYAGRPGPNKFALKPGQWTDDTAMAIALAESLIVHQGYCGSDARVRYYLWWFFGYCNGFSKDLARTSSIGLGPAMKGNLETILSFKGKTHAGVPEVLEGETLPDRGNGSMIRLAPVALLYHQDPELAMEMGALSSRATQPGEDAAHCCRFLAYLLARAIGRAPSRTAPAVFLEQVIQDFMEHVVEQEDSSALRAVLTATPRDDTEAVWNWKQPEPVIALTLVARGEMYNGHPVDPAYLGSYCYDGLALALWAFASTTTMEDCILRAVNLLGDSGSVGAIAGQLAGAFYGSLNLSESDLLHCGVSHLSGWDVAPRALELRAMLLYHIASTARPTADRSLMRQPQEATKGSGGTSTETEHLALVVETLSQQLDVNSEESRLQMEVQREVIRQLQQQLASMAEGTRTEFSQLHQRVKVGEEESGARREIIPEESEIRSLIAHTISSCHSNLPTQKQEEKKKVLSASPLISTTPVSSSTLGSANGGAIHDTKTSFQEDLRRQVNSLQW